MQRDGLLQGGGDGDGLHESGLESLVKGVLVLLLLVALRVGGDLLNFLVKREPFLDGLGDLLDDAIEA